MLRAVLCTKILDKLNSPKSLQIICRKALLVRLFQKKEWVDVTTFELSFPAKMLHLKFCLRPDNVNVNVAAKHRKCDVDAHVSRKNRCHLSSLMSHARHRRTAFGKKPFMSCSQAACLHGEKDVSEQLTSEKDNQHQLKDFRVLFQF